MTRSVAYVVSIAALAGSLALAACGGDKETVITAIEPQTGPTNSEQPVKIMGQNFRPDIGYTIFFGTKRASTVTILSPETILAVSPRRDEAGPVDITIRADDGNAWRIAEGFRYEEGTQGPAGGPAKGSKLAQ